MLSNTLKLSFCYLKIIHILHPHDHRKIIGHVLKNKQKNTQVCIHEIMQLIKLKMELKMKNRSHRYDINRLRSRHGLSVQAKSLQNVKKQNIRSISISLHHRQVMQSFLISNSKVLVDRNLLLYHGTIIIVPCSLST